MQNFLPLERKRTCTYSISFTWDSLQMEADLSLFTGEWIHCGTTIHHHYYIATRKKESQVHGYKQKPLTQNAMMHDSPSMRCSKGETET